MVDDDPKTLVKKRDADASQREETRLDKPARTSSREISHDPDFGPRYRVLGVLGKGGMGEVYRAYDTELQGEVALKVVRAEGDENASLARFRREIALARKVTSPNVLRVYDLAEYAGLRFLSMELVDGDDLAAVMRREGRMPLDRALGIFRQVCAGLEAAHAEGVVHRDLKPQNVLVDKQGNVHVADFGLARSIGESGLTASGTQLGSPAYMSPEQVKGDPVDERSDIYSLGIMLYQLVTGEAPFQAATPHSVMEMRLHKKPRPVREINASVPSYVEAITTRCLQVDPAARYPSIRELRADLDVGRAPPRKRRLLPVVLVGLVIAALGFAAVIVWLHPAKHTEAPRIAAATAPTPGLITVLVLGIDNRTADPVFDDTVEVLLRYALRRSLRLDPMVGATLRRLATELGPDTALDDELGRKLAARDGGRVITLRGAVTSKGVRFTVSLSAKDASTGAEVFVQTLDAPTQDAVVTATGRLASGLRIALGEGVPENERDRTGLSPNLAADHELAVGIAQSSVNDFDGEIVHLELAVAKDPAFGLGYALLGLADWNTHRRVDANVEFERALASVDQMGEREKLKFLGDYYGTVTEDHDRAIASYEKLLETWPKDLGAETNLTLEYQARGDVKRTLELGTIATRDHPYDLMTRSNLPSYELVAGAFERAATDANQVIADFAHPLSAIYLYLALAQMLSGHRDDALAAYAKYAEADPIESPIAAADLALAEGRVGDAAVILEKGIANDVAHKQADEIVELKRAMLAEVRLRRGDKAGARALAALVTKERSHLLSAALIELDAGDVARATAISARLANDITPSSRAIVKLIEGEALRVRGKPQQAMIVIQEALKISDTPLGHFLVARAAIDAKRFADAYAELGTCLARRGEQVIDSDDMPGLRFVPLFTYYLARAQDGIGSSEAKASYQAFLALTHDPDPDDPLVSDARKHMR